MPHKVQESKFFSVKLIEYHVVYGLNCHFASQSISFLNFELFGGGHLKRDRGSIIFQKSVKFDPSSQSCDFFKIANV